MAEVGTLLPYETRTISVPVQVTDAVGIQALAVSFQAENSDAVEQIVASELIQRINYDNKPNASATDDVESDLVTWNTTTEVAEGIGWSRSSFAPPNTVWFAADVGETADQRLESPALFVGPKDFTVRFAHRYLFESSQGDDGLTHWMEP